MDDLAHLRPRRSNIVTKLLRFQSLALVAGMGLFGLIAGCNPDEPAKPADPPPHNGGCQARDTAQVGIDGTCPRDPAQNRERKKEDVIRILRG